MERRLGGKVGVGLAPTQIICPHRGIWVGARPTPTDVRSYEAVLLLSREAPAPLRSIGTLSSASQGASISVRPK